MGSVLLSDGTKIQGPISTTTGKHIVIYGDKKYKIDFRDVASVRMQETKAALLPVWYFKEDGSDEKIYSGEEYPYREYQAVVVTREGKTYTGAMLPLVLNIAGPAGKKLKYIFKVKGKGKPGEKLDSLIMPVTFKRGTGDGAAPAAGPTLRITVEGLRPVFIDSRNFNTLTGEKTGDAWVLHDVTFPLAIAAADDTQVLVSPFAHLTGASREDKTAIDKLIRELPDFYTAKKILYCAADSQTACAVVESVRTEKTSYKKARSFIRYDLWICRKEQGAWQYTKRIFIARTPSPEPVPPRRILKVLDKSWDIPAGKQDLKLQLKPPALEPAPAKGKEKADG